MPKSHIRYKISAARLLIAIILSISYQTLKAQTTAKQYRNSYAQQEPWYLHPLSIQISPHLGLVMPIHLLDIATSKPVNTSLLTVGGRADISLLYPKRWIWEHFDCYPKVGLIIKYDYILNTNVDQKGHIVGSVLYLEPNYKHLSGWEVLPRLGIGIAYVNIPGIFSSTKQNKDEEDGDNSTDTPDVDPFRKEASLNLIFDILLKYRLTPNWHLHFSIGADILPQFKNSNTEDDPNAAKIKRSIEIYTASLGCSYTFNHSEYNPTRKLGYRKSRIDLAYINAFRKARDFISQQTTPGNTQQDDTDKNDNKFYYIGGLHVQWSIQLLDNHALVLASEWIKDLALKKELEQSVRKNNLQASIMLGHEFLWGKLIFGQYAGINLLNNAPPDASRRFGSLPNLFYARLGLSYKITDFLHIGTNLKISLFPASPEKKPLSVEYTRMEYLDFRITYSF